MKQSAFHVTIIGAGLGGLCLGQALLRHGIAFDIYERDVAPGTRPQGYRIRIDETGRTALAACLPESLMILFRHTCAVPGRPDRFLDPHLAPIPEPAVPSWRPSAGTRPEGGDLRVNRLTLREILLSGLEHRVHFGRPFERCAPDPRGGWQVQVAQDRPFRTDLLVAADGVGSAVRQHVLPEAEPDETGTVCLYGRGTAVASVAVPAGPAVVLADGFAVLLDPMIFPPWTEAAETARLTPVPDYVYCAVIGSRARLGLGEESRLPKGRALDDALRSLINSWHPDLQRLILQADPAAWAALPIRVGPPLDGDRWPEAVALLGDAIHAMSPAGGLGANTALADAAALAAALGKAASGRLPLAAAVEAYARDVQGRAAAASQASAEAAGLLVTARSAAWG